MSTDLWSTIEVWLDVLPELSHGERPSLTLITTSAAPDGSAASYLRPESRDVARATELLLEAARSSASQATRNARARFIALDTSDRTQFVSAITVIDNEPRLEALDDLLGRELYYAYPQQHRLAFLERLKGWWYGGAVALLQDRIAAVASRDLVAQIEDLTDEFRADNLPSDTALDDPDEATTTGYVSRPFVRQLNLIAVTNQALQLHLRDYFRAYTQRSRWSRDGLLEPGELDRFERKLVDEWEYAFQHMRGEIEEGAAETDLERAGRELLYELGVNSTARIRTRFDERFLSRGTFHELADQLRVGWHPDYERRLEELLAGRANGGS